MSSESQEFLIGCAPFGDLLVGGSGGEALRNTLRAGAEVRIRVGGTSMLPAIWPGDIVSISCQGTEEPDYPDVVLFKAERRLFVHRVLRSENGRLITRGDALPHCDPPVDVADVIGVVTEILRVRGSELVSMPVGRPSSGRRALAFVIRRSELARTIVLKWRRTFSQLSSVGMLGEESPGIDPPLRSG